MLNFMADAFSDRGALLKQADALEAALDNLNDALLLSPHHRSAIPALLFYPLQKKLEKQNDLRYLPKRQTRGWKLE